MESIIIGGGKIGYNLLKTLKERGYQVTLVERDRDICARIADELDADVICGDGTDLEVLDDAGIAEAEIVAAVTGTDEENLVICQIAKISFHIQKTIARVNNPKNIEMFKALGVDRIVCSTEVIANLIESELDREEYRIIQTFERGSMLLVELDIGHSHPWCSMVVKDLRLPQECVITSIVREEKVIYPRGDTQIHEGDKVLFITNHTALMELMDFLRDRRS
ncbi:potassium channel family protein [Caproiciproducens faecalis]|uniref:Trk system potassium uptake protein TrkA n=1 Tax=Caproiciproducens faecalis TaxID=2820301 RepID=A0ABS7DRD2_9FIRM|nr:NAD-binding protein [Caproiciproducens faecalis]MBW7573855.1 NAD-binding protein [Caproiciproducens faecalis]